MSQPSGASRGDEGQNRHRVLVPLAAEVLAKAETALPPEKPKPANQTADDRARAIKSDEPAVAPRNRAVKPTVEAEKSTKNKKEKPRTKAKAAKLPKAKAKVTAKSKGRPISWP